MPEITGLTGVQGLTSGSLIGKTAESSEVSFADMLTDAVREADDAYAVTQEDTKALLAGEADDLAQIMINGTKAELSLNLVLQVRNKVIDAYNEVMRMQV